MKIIITAALTALCLPAAALAQDGKLEVSDAYLRSSNPQSAAGFMTISNGTQGECTLTAATSDAAEKVELHTHREGEGGMMEMVAIEGGITIPAGESHALARGGDHVMLMGLTGPLEGGDEVAVTLDFGDCGTLDVMLPLDNDRVGDESDAAMDHDNHSH